MQEYEQMENFLQLTVPLPPSINEMYATVNGMRVLSSDGRKFKKKVAQIVQKLESGGILTKDLHRSFKNHYIGIFLDFNFKTPLKRDLDGGLKIAVDALCEALGINDNKVVELYLTKHIDPLNPHVFMELKALPDWQIDKEYIVQP